MLAEKTEDSKSGKIYGWEVTAPEKLDAYRIKLSNIITLDPPASGESAFEKLANAFNKSGELNERVSQHFRIVSGGGDGWNFALGA